MKAVAINGSPRKGGNTEQMLNIVLDTIKKSGIETKLIQIGGTNIHGCRGYWACAKIKNGKCAFNDDILNELLDEVYSADALILGTPSYFADMTPELKAFIDRVGVVAGSIGNPLKHKIGAAVVAQRRGGGPAIQASIHHMFLMKEMIIPGSLYWNFGIGRDKGEVQSDEEAKANMVNLGENIVWLLEKISK